MKNLVLYSPTLGSTNSQRKEEDDPLVALDILPIPASSVASEWVFPIK